MSGWEVGDLALCVNTSDLTGAGSVGLAGRKLVRGRVYCVCGVGFEIKGDFLRLDLEELRNHPWGPSAAAKRFIKVTPPADMVEDGQTAATGVDQGEEVPA